MTHIPDGNVDHHVYTMRPALGRRLGGEAGIEIPRPIRHIRIYGRIPMLYLYDRELCP